MTYLSICIMYGTIPQVDKDSTQSYKILYKKKSMQYIKSIHRQIQKLNENHRGFLVQVQSRDTLSFGIKDERIIFCFQVLLCIFSRVS